MGGFFSVFISWSGTTILAKIAYNDQVVLKEFVKAAIIDTKIGSVHYTELEIKLSRNEYKNQVVSFALQVKKLFHNSKEKRISDDFDKELYEDFWNEYNQLLKQTSH